jgi:hypothetical protein
MIFIYLTIFNALLCSNNRIVTTIVGTLKLRGVPSGTPISWDSWRIFGLFTPVFSCIVKRLFDSKLTKGSHGIYQRCNLFLVFEAIEPVREVLGGAFYVLFQLYLCNRWKLRG